MCKINAFASLCAAVCATSTFAVVLQGNGLNLRAAIEKAEALEGTLDRMQWWAPAGAPLPVTDRYLLFTGDAGGPNNIRIGWEMTGLVAFVTNRTLVLPPPWAMYLLDGGPMTNWPAGTERATGSTTRVEDLINLQQLKGSLPTLTWEEFEKQTGLSWDAAMSESHQVDEQEMCSFSSYKKVSEKLLFMSGSGGRREGFSCGEWWLRGGPKDEIRTEMTAASWGLLTHGFVWHPDAFDIAAHVVNELGIFEYNAIHARYNDFQFHDDQSTAAEILKRWTPFFMSGSKLYVASDQPEKLSQLHGLNKVKAVMFKDEEVQSVLKDVKTKYSEERWFKMLGPVEELICTFAKVFIGTKSSSFSGHINRMRVHAQAPETEVWTLKEAPNVTKISRDVASWQAGEFKRKEKSEGDVFVQFPDFVPDAEFVVELPDPNV